MAKKIYALRIQKGTFSRTGDERLYVEFADSEQAPEGTMEWTPRWLEPGRGVADLLRSAVQVERANRPGSAYLVEFAALARDILIEHAPPIEVEIVTGRFKRYFLGEQGRPNVEVQRGHWVSPARWWDDGTIWIPLGIPLSEQLVRSLALEDKELGWVVWNRELIDLRSGATSLITPST